MRFRLLLTALACALACAAADSPIRISTLSNRPDKVSGGDVLVLVSGAAGQDPKIKLNGAEVTSVFRPGRDAGSLLGMVTGLKVGRNLLEVFRPGDASAAAELALVNAPITGPVFSGPQETPFVCQTETFKLPDGKPLGRALDEYCTVETTITYLYHPNGAKGFKPLDDNAALPPDVAMTTTSSGNRVPFVVRVETGTINRSIYQIAILHDPTSESAPSPFNPVKGWNGRLLYSFGGGCTGGWYRQGTTVGAVISENILAKGYASASASLNVFGNNCQDITAAETMMMVKEHFIETYGAPAFTFGRGGSGGSYQQIQIGDNYPGLLDGIIPSATFPDVLATIQFLSDAQLLANYFKLAGDSLTEEQKLAISGVGVIGNITNTANGAGRINPTTFCPPELPQALRYHAINNPSGARCDVFDHTVNAYGRDPATGFARRPVDNTGVQYGLAALNSGAISAGEFLDLNERIGGHDNDGNLVAARTSADPLALRAAYTTGRVTNGGGGLAGIPIIDVRRYTDKNKGDLHLKYHSFSFRARLERANGTAGNEVMLVAGPEGSVEDYAIAKIDEWLTNVARDTAPGSARDRVLRSRPDDLKDSCYARNGVRIVEPQTATGGECDKLYPTFPSPAYGGGRP